MANLSNINGKFLFTDGDFLLIGGATANSISATESGVAIKNSNAATLSLQNSATNGKNHTLWSNTDGSFNITDVGVATRFTIASGGDVYIPSGNVSIGNTSVYPSGSNTILQIYSASVPRLKLQNSTTGTASTAGSSFYVTGDDLIINNGETGAIIQFEIGGQSKMRIDGDGNVGIGTISPDITGFGYRTLTVVGGTLPGYAGVLELGCPTTNADGQNLGIIAFIDGGTRNAQIDVTRASSTSTSNMHFYTNGGSGIEERMRIDSSGNIGIGQSPYSYSRLSTEGSDNTSSNYAFIAYSENTNAILACRNDGTVTMPTGNVGIGITPTSKLMVKDSSDSGFDSGIAIIRSANSQTGYINMVGGAMNFNSPSIPITFRQSGTEKMRITSGGQLGVNTSTFAPTISNQIKLGNMGSGVVGEVFDANVVDGAGRMIICSGGSSGQVPILSLRHYSAAYGIDLWMGYTNPWNTYIDNRHPSSGFIFRNNCNANGSEDELMRITGSGNVGIGTTTPNYQLEVRTTTNNRAIQAVNSTTSGTNWGFQGGAYGSGATKNIGLQVTAEGASTNYAAIFENGNVGIGTTSPQSKLHVNGGGINLEQGGQLTERTTGVEASATQNTWYAVHTFNLYELTLFFLLVGFEDDLGDGNNKTAVFVDSGTLSYGSGFAPTRLSGSTSIEARRAGQELQIRFTHTAGGSNRQLRWSLITVTGN
jgi:hypothetical protein